MQLSNNKPAFTISSPIQSSRLWLTFNVCEKLSCEQSKIIVNICRNGPYVLMKCRFFTKTLFIFNLCDKNIGHFISITFFSLTFVEICSKVGWFCPIWDIYARFVKREVDCSQLLLSLTLLTIQSSGYMNVPYAQYIDRKIPLPQGYRAKDCQSWQYIVYSSSGVRKIYGACECYKERASMKII